MSFWHKKQVFPRMRNWSQPGEGSSALKDVPSVQSPRSIKIGRSYYNTFLIYLPIGWPWSRPYFKILRKPSKFTWDEKCDQAFTEINEYLSGLPTLFKLVAGENYYYIYQQLSRWLAWPYYEKRVAHNNTLISLAIYWKMQRVGILLWKSWPFD